MLAQGFNNLGMLQNLNLRHVCALCRVSSGISSNRHAAKYKYNTRAGLAQRLDEVGMLRNLNLRKGQS